MSFQLIFTSAPRGLILGRSGFCTVARHKDISDSLVTVLERLSAYERTDDSPGNLPVIHAYRILRLGSAVYHVLTRIQDAGVDYTQRGNHLAQHLIFLPSELKEIPTPADIFLNWDGWLESWSESPRYLETSEKPALSSTLPGTGLPARFWLAQTGDAANAALPAHPEMLPGIVLTAASLPSREALSLIGESLLLIETHESGPPGSWTVPFTTHLQTHEQEQDFFWRVEEAANPTFLSSRCGFPIFSLDHPSWPPIMPPSLAKRAREGGASVIKLNDTARLPNLTLPTDDLDVVPKISRRTPSSFPQATPSKVPSSQNAWLLPSVAVGLIVVILAGALFYTQTSGSASARSISEQITALKTPGQREALRLYLREHPPGTGNEEADSSLRQAAVWLEAADYVDRLQFLRRQEQASSLEETLHSLQNLPQFPDLKLALPQLGYEIEEAQSWIARQTPAPAEPTPASVPQTTEPSPAKASVTLAQFLGTKPYVLTTISSDNTVNIPFPEATAWLENLGQQGGGQVRIVPLDRLPLSGEGILAKPHPPRNRTDPTRFYQGVHLLFEARKTGDSEGNSHGQLIFPKDFASSAPDGTFGWVLQFEDSSGVLFSIFLFKEGVPGPLLRLPRSMIDFIPSVNSYSLRNEFSQGTQGFLGNQVTAFLAASPMEKAPPGSLPAGEAISWVKLMIPSVEKNLPVGLYLRFSTAEEPKDPFLFLLFEDGATP